MKDKVHLQRNEYYINPIKRNNERINIQHIFCAALITFGLFVFLILSASVQASASFEDMYNEIAIQSEPMVEKDDYSRSITPQLFGATGDGERDDTEAFLALTSYCNANPGTDIYIPAGHYIILKPLKFTKNVSIHGCGQNSFLDFSQITDVRGAAIEISGSYQELGQLATNHKAGEKSLQFKETNAVNRNDLIAVLDPEDFSWNNLRRYYRKGEFCEVFSCDHNTIELAGFLRDDYSGDCNVLLMNMVRCEVSGLSILVHDRGSDLGIDPLVLCCVRDALVRDVTAKGSNYAQVVVKQSYNVLLDHVLADYISQADIGLNYGIAVSNSQLIRVVNSSLNAMRHGMAIGGGSEGACIVNRFVSITDSEINSQTCTAADIHANSQYIQYDRCTILNGIDLSGSDVSINNCDIHSGRYSVWASIKLTASDNLSFVNNHFYSANADDNKKKDYLFTLLMSPDKNGREGTIFLKDNIFESENRKTILISASNCENRSTLLMTGNTIKGGMICVENVFSQIIKNNILEAEYQFFDPNKSSVSSLENIVFTDNVVRNINGNGIRVSALLSTPSLVNISGNTFIGISNVAVFVLTQDKDNVDVNENNYISCKYECILQ